MLKIFPHALARIGGVSYDRFETLNLKVSLQSVHEILTLEQDIDQLKNTVSEALFVKVQSLYQKPTLQKCIINLRRDLFNNRQIAKEKLDFVTAHLELGLLENVNTLIVKQEQLRSLKSDSELVFNEEVKSLREAIKRFGQDEIVQKGLLLSSQSLLQSIESYVTTDISEFRKREFHTEQSLIKYLSRMVAKTSPFSTFNQLAVVSVDGIPNSNNSLLSFRGGTGKVISHIRLNNSLFQYVKGLFIKNPEIYRRMWLRPNPTIQKKENHYIFLTNSNNIEAFQRMPVNSVIEVFRVLASEHREGIIYHDMIQAIILNEYIDADVESLEEFANQLIQYGFLEFNIGVSGIDPDWDIKLREKLKTLSEHVPLISEYIDVLRFVRQLAKDYEVASIHQRREILQETYEIYRSVCMKLHAASGLPKEERNSREEYLREQSEKQKLEQAQKKETQVPEGNGEQKEMKAFKHEASTFFYFKPEQMFYEDTTLDVDIQLNADSVKRCINCLHKLLQQTTLFDGVWEEREAMVHFYRNKYGEQKRVDLLTFYEDYYKDFKKPEAERLEKLKKTQKNNLNNKPENLDTGSGHHSAENFEIPSHRDRRQLRKRWKEKFLETIISQITDSNCEIMLNFETVRSVNNSLSIAKQSKASSYGCFLQLFKDHDGYHKAVVNGTFPGYGKMFSRFLHVVDSGITENLRRWNQTLHEGKLLLEDCDASYFNANLHPPLMPFEVWMPSGHNSLPEDQQIAVTDLDVIYDTVSNQLQLIHKTKNEPVFIFDMGFQGHGGRSQLFQLLEKFTLARHLSTYSLHAAINNSLAPKADNSTERKADRIAVRPRIVYDDCLILQRKAWFIPRSLLPSLLPKESDWSYFERVNRWRIQHSIPDEIFIFVVSRGARVTPEKEAVKKITRDDYKPQYINFRNPFLVKLFEKLLPKVSDVLRIEEMLPNSSQYNEIEGKPLVTEFVVQWYDSEEETVEP